MLKVEDLNISLNSRDKTVYPVRNVSFEIHEGESVGIIGESGCGKTTLALAIKGLLKDAKIDGTIQAPENMGMVFQSPMTSLNPTMKILSQITEGMIYRGKISRGEAKKRALDLLKLVGIDNPEQRAKQYPHHLSGGQRQRVSIAIALGLNPKLLIADEPTTALDVTVQAQIIDLLKSLQKKLNMSLMLISHDLGVIRRLCDRILVFYAGKIVEQGKTFDIFQAPKHPYTQMLMLCKPSAFLPRIKPLKIIEGAPPLLSEREPGCSFLKRCPYRSPECEVEPPFFGSAACWREK